MAGYGRDMAGNMARIWQAIWQAAANCLCTLDKDPKKGFVDIASYNWSHEQVYKHRYLTAISNTNKMNWRITCRVFTKGWERPVDIMGCTRLVASVFQVLPRA